MTYRVGLFVTCLVDLFRPQIAFAGIKLLENANCVVIAPSQQTCCGQPAYNNGDDQDTRHIAKQVINTFQEFDYVVVPSGSCAGMIRKHYPLLFKNDSHVLPQAQQLAAKTFELVSFLTDVLQIEKVTADYANVVTYHDSCSALRELKIKNQPRSLLAGVNGLQIREIPEAEVCCGFGGTFCVKFPAISNKMVSDKIACIQSTNAHTVLSTDLGCLMNIAGKLQRLGSKMKVLHVAEVLANMGHGSGIGERQDKSA